MFLLNLHLKSFLPQMLLSIMNLQLSNRNLDVLVKCVKELAVYFLGKEIAYILLEENANCAGVHHLLVVLVAVADVVVVLI